MRYKTSRDPSLRDALTKLPCVQDDAYYSLFLSFSFSLSLFLSFSFSLFLFFSLSLHYSSSYSQLYTMKLLESMHHHAKEHNVPIIDDPTKQYITSLLKTKKPRYCLEIGSAIGYSWIIIAKEIIQRWGTLMSFECSYPSYMKALAYTKNSRLLNMVLYFGDFLKFWSHILPDQIDFLFIDAEKASYLKYYLKCLPSLHSQSVVLFDDIIKYKQKTADLIQYLKKNEIDFERKQLTEDDGVIIIENW